MRVPFRRALPLFAAAATLTLAIENAGAVVCDRGGTLQKLGPENGVPCPQPLSEQEKTATIAALDRLSLTYFDGCARCLKNMLHSKRICKCDADVGARTFPSPLPPACNPELDGLCLGASFFPASLEVQACILAHEWLHTIQPADLSYNCMQLEAFKLERDCLTNLGQATPKAPGFARFQQMARLAMELSTEICPAAPQKGVPALPEPRTGAKTRDYAGVNYTILSHDPTLYGIPASQDTTYEYPLAMTTPFNFINLGGVEGTLIVSGLIDSTDTGILETLAVSNGRVTEQLAVLEMPGIHPFGLAYAGSFYILDTSRSRILILEDGDGDGIPESLSPIPFARAIDFPILLETLSIEPIEGGLALDTRDRRLAEDLIEPDREFSILADVDFDRTADLVASAVGRNYLKLIPGFVDLPTDSSETLRILASAGSDLILTLTDSTGVPDMGTLGAGGVPLTSNDGLITLDVDLIEGTYVRIDDLTTYLSSYAARVNSESVPVLLAYFAAERRDREVILRWGIAGESRDHAGFHVHREDAGGERARITGELLSGRESYEFIDREAPEAATRYWLEDIGRTGAIRWHGPIPVPPLGEPAVPSPELLQNSPNPFRGSTRFTFRTAVEGMAVLHVFDLAGREIARPLAAYLPAGHHEAEWDGRDANGRPVAAGTYFYRLDARGGTLTRKLVLL